MNYKEKLNNINAVCFFTKDFEGSRKFFEDIWGFKAKRVQPPVEETGFTTNFIEYNFKGATIAIWDEKEVKEICGEEAIGGDSHNYMTAVKLKNPEDVDELHEEFSKRGVVCISEPTTYNFGSRAAYYLDHEKNVWEFFAWTEGGEDGPALVSE